MKITIDDGGR